VWPGWGFGRLLLVYAEVGTGPRGRRGLLGTYNMTDKLDAIKSAHTKLMVEYLELINQASTLGFLVQMNIFPSKEELTRFVGTQRIDKIFEFFNKTLRIDKIFEFFNKDYIKAPMSWVLNYKTLGFLVRLFVESHIKGQLNRLADYYVHLAQTISTDEPSYDRDQNWLKDTEERTKKFANTLSSFRRISGLIGTFLPWVSSILIAVLGVTAIQHAVAKGVQNPILTLLFGLFLCILAVYLYMFVTFAFIYKRNLFSRSDSYIFNFVIEFIESFKSKEIRQQREHVNNVYQTEDKLFDLLEKKKILELPIDCILSSILLFVLDIIIAIWMYIEEIGFCLYIIAIFMIVLIFLSAILYIMAGFKLRGR
jgi:membrane protein YdbS with pleckstrin-like domain